MERRIVPLPPPKRLLACPHCGPETNKSTHGCSRCGGELLLFDAEECARRWPAREAPRRAPAEPAPLPVPVPIEPGHVPSRAGALGVVLLIVALAGLLRFWDGTQPRPETNQPSAAAGHREPARPAGLPQGVDLGTPQALDGTRSSPDLEPALERYRAALADRPDDPQLLDNVGQILVALDRPAEAVPFIARSVELEPFSLTARFNLAVAYARCGRLNEAVDLYGALAQTGSTDPRIHHNLGLALRQLGRNGQAAEAFGRATALAPGESPGWLGLALSLEAEGRGAEAATALERYLALEPDAPDADNIRARIALLMGTAERPPTPPDAGTAAPRRCP